MKPQEAQALADKEFMEALNEPFPIELIHRDYYMRSADMITYESPKTLQTSWNTFKRLLTGDIEQSIAEVGIGLNAITNRTMVESGLVYGSYIDMQDWAFGMAAEWNKIVSTTQQRINSKYSTMLKLTAMS